jgi:hypothetical protein
VQKTTPAFVVMLATLAMFMTAAKASARQRVVRPGNPPDAALMADVLKIENDILAAYAPTDFAWVWEQKVVHGDRDNAANFIVIPLVRGAAYTLKYELQGPNAEYVTAALDNFELAERLYPYWGHGWLSPSAANFQALAVNRLRQLAGSDALFASRLQSAHDRAMEILSEENNGLMGQVLPLEPLDSSNTGDSKAEEDAWVTAPLGAGAALLRDSTNAATWEAKAKEVAYAAITRPSDPPYKPDAVKTTTVTEDFCLNNHGFRNNAYYTAATIELLQQGAVAYLVAGEPVPTEFGHNVQGLYAKYQSYISTDANGWPAWNVQCDEGNPTDLPLAMGDGSEYRYAALKAQRGYLWRAVTVKNDIAGGDELWAAVQNHKVAWRYFVNVYLWHWPNPVSTPINDGH